MTYRSILSITRPIGLIGACVVLSGSAVAANLGGDPSIDSRISLVRSAQEWRDHLVSITLSTELGTTTLTVETDGRTRQTTLPYREYEDLWRRLLEQEIGGMGDGNPPGAFPDQSTFVLTVQNGLDTHTFEAYGVDFIADTRYGDIFRSITELAERHLPSRATGIRAAGARSASKVAQGGVAQTQSLTLPAPRVNTTVTGALGDLDGNGDAGAAEAVVLRAAVDCWDARVTTNRDFALTVNTMPLMNARGTGGITAVTGGIPTAGTITIEDGTNVAWFVDPTPLTALEFTPDPGSPWRFINGTGAAANADLLRAVMHEIGHAMGWVCGAAACNVAPDNFNYDGLMVPQPANFVTGTNVTLQATPGFNVTLRGDGLDTTPCAANVIVNELSHVGPPGPFNSVSDMMFGRTGNGVRETPSMNNVDMFMRAYADNVNLPPTINAGADRQSECSSVGGSDVTLNAGGSTDPENDVLTYAWTCPAGITIDNQNAASTNAFFPVNQTTTCRVDATDLAACPSDADQVRVMVVDTTDPRIDCPGDASVECATTGGTQASDADVMAFLLGADATDVCDDSVAVTDDAPDLFNLGSTAVEFIANDDSGNDATCSANLTVVDTTDPVITCPGDVNVECSATGGSPASDPDITAFLAGATASDICDAQPDITDDAPGFFGLGATGVVFTATDDSSNTTTCPASVTVQDTIAPQIDDLSANPDTLWPPNHKMVPVTIEVVSSDVCDASHACRIVTVSSNEPLVGDGSGVTSPDWQVIGDLSVRLRAERTGRGDGRTYEIQVQCDDESGNSSRASTFVSVRHDQRGRGGRTSTRSRSRAP